MMTPSTLKERLLSRLDLLPVILLAVLTGVLAIQVRLLQVSASGIDHTDQVISSAHDLLRSIVDQETGIRGYLLTGQAELLAPYTQGHGEIDQRFSKLRQLVADNPSQEERLNVIHKETRDWAAFEESCLRAKKTRDEVIADRMVGTHLLNHIRVLAREFIDQEDVLRAERSANSSLLSGATLITFLLIGALAAGAAVFYTRRLKKSREMFRDLAMRNAAGEEALHESENRYRTLFESIDEGFCIIQMIFDESGKPVDYLFLETNPSFQKQTGLVDAVGKTMRHFAPNFEQHWFDDYGRIAMTGEAARFQNRAEPLQRYFDVYAFRFGRPEDRRVAVLFNDISQRMNSERALLRAEKLAVIGRMASTVAHEINNPLGAALNSLYLAMLDDTLSDSTSQHIELAQRELERVAHITKQTLGFYRETGTPSKIDLREVADGVVNLYMSKLEDKDIRLERRYLTQVLVYAIEGEVRQILSNLLSNGIDAVPAHGYIRLRVSGPSALDHLRPELCLTVSDNGAGIDPKHFEHIFEPFFSTKVSTGTGLGLWVTQQLVKRHDGRIRARSKMGVGTVFRVFLPAERRREERPTEDDQIRAIA